jgi:glucose-6-phosphate 1-dehydrogenase
VRNYKKTVLDFNGISDTHVQYVQEFVKIFKSVINNDKSLFLDFEEIKYMWQFTDAIFNKINYDLIFPTKYQKGIDWDALG